MLPFSFCLGLVALWAQAIFFPTLPINPLIPFVALTCLLSSFAKAPWLSLLAGLSIDVLSSDPLGIYALNYSLVALLCYSWRNRFSADVPLQFSLYTAFVSLVSLFLQLILLFLFDRRVPFDGNWWEWSSLPGFDALYAFVWFAGPLALFQFVRKTAVIYWLKKKDPSTT